MASVRACACCTIAYPHLFGRTPRASSALPPGTLTAYRTPQRSEPTLADAAAARVLRCSGARASSCAVLLLCGRRCVASRGGCVYVARAVWRARPQSPRCCADWMASTQMRVDCADRSNACGMCCTWHPWGHLFATAFQCGQLLIWDARCCQVRLPPQRRRLCAFRHACVGAHTPPCPSGRPPRPRAAPARA